MKKKLLSMSTFFLIITLYVSGNAMAADKELVSVLNPTASANYVERVPLSPRLDTLEGKTIYMLDINWGGPQAAYSVFEQMQDWFAQNMPSVKVIIKRKRGSYMVPDDSTWKEVKDNGGDAAIVGISG